MSEPAELKEDNTRTVEEELLISISFIFLSAY
jgi:hypothetical protein